MEIRSPPSNPASPPSSSPSRAASSQPPREGSEPHVNAASAPLLRDLSGRRLGRYEVLMQLASGGMATVYVARAQGVAGFERLVAVKVLHPHLAHDEEFI